MAELKTEIWYGAVVGAVAACACLLLLGAGTQALLTWAGEAPAWYRDPALGLSVAVPATWRPSRVPLGQPAAAFRGQSGFAVLVPLAVPEGTLASAATAELLRSPGAGTQPRVASTTVAGQSALVAVGSAGVGALLVQYPKPVVLGGTTYRYLVLLADQAHLGSIANSMKLTPVPEASVVPVGAAPQGDYQR